MHIVRALSTAIVGLIFPISAGAAEQAGQPCLGLEVGDVVVATVKNVSDEAATNGNPPRLELEVNEVLRGDPKPDRSRAVWMPQPHGFDFGDLETMRKHVRRWEAQPLKSPRAGDKFVLWGEMAGQPKQPVFHAFSWHAYHYSARKREWAIEVIREAREQARLRTAMREAEAKAIADARAEWRAKTSADDLKKYVAEADVVALGRIVSEAPHNIEGGILIRVTKQFKGERRRKYRDGAYYVEIVAPEGVRDLLDRDTDYLLFLAEEGLKAGPSVDYYPRIESGDGMVIADRAALEAVKKALGRE